MVGLAESWRSAGIVLLDKFRKELQQALNGVDGRVDQPKALLCAWVIVSWSVSAPETTSLS